MLWVQLYPELAVGFWTTLPVRLLVTSLLSGGQIWSSRGFLYFCY